MSDIFESAVYALRQSAPFASPKVIGFILEKARWNDEPVVLTVKHRPSVASRLWWSLEWSEGNQHCEVSAQDWELLFWRAIQKHKQKERQRQLELQPVTKGPIKNSFGMAEAKGWEGGDGI